MADRFLGKWVWLLCPLVIYEHLYIAPNSWPIATAPATPPKVYQHIPNNQKAVLDLPADLGVSNQTNRYLFWQRIHHHPVPYSNKVSAIGIASKNPAVVKWASISRDVEGYIEGLDPKAEISAKLLLDEQYTAIVLHLELLKNTQEERKYQEITQLFGPPQKIDDTLLWLIKAP